MNQYDDEEFIDFPARRRKVALLGLTTVVVIIAALAANRNDNDEPDLVAGAGTTARAVPSTTSAPAGATSATVTPASVSPTVTVAGTTAIPPTTRSAASSTTVSTADPLLFRRPMNGKIIVSLAWDCYNCVDWPTLRGKHHPAVDYTSDDKRIVASADGVVEKINTGCANGVAGCGNSYGNWIFLKHNMTDGRVLYSFYAHLSEIDPSIKIGACIKTAQQVGIMGSSGISSAAHLHFNVQTNTNLLEYTRSSSVQFGSINPDTLYSKARVKACS